QRMRAFLVRLAQPPQRFLSQMKAPATTTPESATPIATEPGSVSTPVELTDNESHPSEARRQVEVLSEENSRLRDILELKRQRWPHAVVAHVAGRDPQRWFQEIVLDKGKEEGLDIDDPGLSE